MVLLRIKRIPVLLSQLLYPLRSLTVSVSIVEVVSLDHLLGQPYPIQLVLFPKVFCDENIIIIIINNTIRLIDKFLNFYNNIYFLN